MNRIYRTVKTIGGADWINDHVYYYAVVNCFGAPPM